MSSTAPHQALYRRWRAQRFSEIVGQTAVVETLRNAVRTDRVSHAILFVGPSVNLAAVERVAEQLDSGPPEQHGGMLVVPKLGPTPPGFPRRPGMARKRPLA